MAEQWAFNPLVQGSTPWRPTRKNVSSISLGVVRIGVRMSPAALSRWSWPRPGAVTFSNYLAVRSASVSTRKLIRSRVGRSACGGHARSFYDLRAVRANSPQDGPAAIAWLRNDIVHAANHKVHRRRWPIAVSGLATLDVVPRASLAAPLFVGFRCRADSRPGQHDSQRTAAGRLSSVRRVDPIARKAQPCVAQSALSGIMCGRRRSPSEPTCLSFPVGSGLWSRSGLWIRRCAGRKRRRPDGGSYRVRAIRGFRSYISFVSVP
jgi:hypothetical protein